jgi:hypothetical protein
MATLIERLTTALQTIAADVKVASNGLPYTFADPLTVRDGLSPLRMEGAGKILAVTAAAKTAPTGSTLIVDMLKNGTTIFTGGTNRPAIAISGFSARGTPAVTTYADGDLFLPQIDQIGSTIAGGGLTVTLWVRRTS